MTHQPRVPRRALELGGVAALTVAAVGYMSGLGTPPDASGYTDPSHERGSESARNYSDLREGGPAQNAKMYGVDSSLLRKGLPGLNDEVVQADEDREAALRARAAHRAYDGAPPTIPHAIDQRGMPSCLTCHEAGAQLDGRVAPVMSHPRHDSCTQCHVVATSPSVLAEGNWAPNEFEPLALGGKGEVAWEGAPPTIPHSTHMRENCGSCHGVAGRLGMRSTHPWRQSCTQCHAPSAELDQRAAISFGDASFAEHSAAGPPGRSADGRQR